MLQRGPWSGPELAAHLGVTQRSVRRDVHRLRDLGYPVAAVGGPGGGYRLVAGGAVPPLVLDDEAAVAVAVCLRLASLNPIDGIGDGALRALTVLDRVLPARLRRQVDALYETTETLPAASPGETVAAATLLALARSCWETERVHLTYRTRAGEQARRRVEPYRLVTTGRRWYLFAWDVDRVDWRTFRVDRVSAVEPTGWRFAARSAPPAREHVRQAITQAPYRWQVRLRAGVPAQRLGEMSPAAVEVRPDPGGFSCELRFGVHELDHAVTFVASLLLRHPEQVEIIKPDELRSACREIGRRLQRMGRPTAP